MKSLLILISCWILHSFSDESLIPKIISKFEPDEETIFFDPDSEKPERLIFEIDGPYRDFEEEGLAELEEYILQHEVSINSIIDSYLIILNRSEMKSMNFMTELIN